MGTNLLDANGDPLSDNRARDKGDDELNFNRKLVVRRKDEIALRDGEHQGTLKKILISGSKSTYV